MNVHERVCSLTLDEMAIEPKRECDRSTGLILGSIDLPEHPADLATHALVFMLAGVSSRWKQTIGYFMTGKFLSTQYSQNPHCFPHSAPAFLGNSTKGSVYKNIVLDIVQRSANIGLDVVNITSDMGMLIVVTPYL